MTQLTTASGLDDAMLCAAKAVLPSQSTTGDAAERGTAAHTYIERVTNGADPDLVASETPEEYRSWVRHIDVDALNDELTDLRPEVPMAINYQTRAARCLPKMGSRDYSAVREHEFAGTIDLIATNRHSQGVVIRDYKTGATLGDPVAKMQLRWAAAAVFLERGYIGKIRVEYTYILEDSSHRTEHGFLDTFDHMETLDRLADLGFRISQAQAMVDAGKSPHTSPGDHCRFCSAWHSCPSKTGLMRRLMAMNVDDLASMDAVDMAALWQGYIDAQHVVDRLKPVINEYVAQRPIRLENGLVKLTTRRKSAMGVRKLTDLAREYGAPESAISDCMQMNTFSYPIVSR